MRNNILMILSGGVLFLSLSCNAADKAPKQEPAKQPDKTAKAVSREDKQKEEWKAKINSTLQELKKYNIRPWPSSDKKDLATEPGAYKVKAKDGKISFPEKIEDKDYPEYVEIYKRAATGAMVNNGNGLIPTYRWDPIYWSEKDKKWILYPPAQLEFNEAKSKQELILIFIGRFCVAQEFDKCGYNLGVLKNSGPNIKPDERSKLLSELDGAAIKAGTPWGGGDILSKIYQISVDLDSERDPGKLVALASERQKLIESATAIILKK